MQNIDSSHQYTQNELPSDIFNSGNGDIKTFNGQQVHVQVNGNGTRSLTPVSQTEQTVNSAKALRDFTIQSNQPAIGTLQKNSTDLQSRYADLLDSIKSQQQVGENAQILATSQEMGRRGITSDSGVAQQEQANALRPIEAQYQGLTAQTGLGEQQDLNSIASQIASLQAGDPAGAIAGGLNIGSLQNQAAQTQATLQAAQGYNQALIQAAQIGAQYHPIQPGGSLYNAATGQTVGGNTFTPSSSGGYSGSGSVVNTAPIKPSISTLTTQPIGYSSVTTAKPSTNYASTNNFAPINTNGIGFGNLSLAGSNQVPGNQLTQSGQGYNNNYNVLGLGRSLWNHKT